MIRSNLAAENSSFIKLNDPTKVKFRLFCFPHAGGGASLFKRWPRFLSEDIELFALQLPGRESRFGDPLMTEINRTMTTLHDDFPFDSEVPFVFLGHSMGALLAFELCRELRRTKGVQPFHFIASGATAPQCCQKKRKISKLSDADFLEKIKSYGGIEDCLLRDQELMSLLLPMLRADFSIFESYDYTDGRPFSFEMTTITGTEDATCEFEDVLKWDKHIEGTVRHVKVPGGHFFIKESPMQVLEIVNQLCDEYKHI